MSLIWHYVTVYRLTTNGESKGCLHPMLYPGLSYKIPITRTEYYRS